MGRKPISGVRKFGRMVVMLTDDERELLDQAAEIVGKPTSTWTRDEILDLARKVVSTKEAASIPRKKSPAKKR